MNMRLLRNKNFMALWFGQMISFIGDYFNWLAIPITINQLTGSAAMVGLSMISNAVPALVLGPVAGVFVDRLDRRKVMIASDLIRATLVLCLLTIHSAEQVWIFYVIGFLNSCTSQFFFPARSAVLPLVVDDPEDWLPANGMMQIIQTIGLIAGPALAGFSIGLWGGQAAFVANSIGYLTSAAFVMSMVVPRTTPGSAPGGTTMRVVLADLREGLAYLFGNRTMVGVTIVMTIAMLGIGGVNVVWVPYLQRAFGIGAEGLGIVDSAQGVGMVISGVALGAIARKFPKVLMISVGSLGIGAAIAAMGYVPRFEMIIVLSFILGLGIIPVTSALTTIMQIVIPDAKRGRVGSSMNAISTTGSLASMGFVTLFGEAIGLNNVYLLVGGFIFFSGVIGFWMLKEPKKDPTELVNTNAAAMKTPDMPAAASSAADQQMAEASEKVTPDML